MLSQGGAKSETGITFWAPQLFLGAPGPPRGPFHIQPQINPISILRLPMEHVSSWAFLHFKVHNFFQKLEQSCFGVVFKVVIQACKSALTLILSMQIDSGDSIGYLPPSLHSTMARPRGTLVLMFSGNLGITFPRNIKEIASGSHGTPMANPGILIKA